MNKILSPKKMEANQPAAEPKREGSTLMKIGARGLGVVGGFIAVLTGIWLATSIITGNLGYFGVGVWQACSGLICLSIEASLISYCCPKLSDIIARQPYWAKSLLYVGMGLPPVFFMYFSIWMWLGSGSVFATGVLYGFLTLGKRASLSEMARATSGAGDARSGNSVVPTSPLVNNEQAMGLSAPPASAR